eukprot:g8833.t1
MLAENTLVSPLPGLGKLKSGNSDAYSGLPGGDPTPGSQTPTSSADPASERIDPVLLLSRPVEGFNHPRQHVFTDRLLGRFYEDSSLDAETRKTSKCLAGRLGTAGSHTSNRPSTTATTNSHFRPSRSPTTTRRGGKRMRGSASARALGSSREPGAGLAGRKEQIQNEILEQKALIERLEGRVASLSCRGRRSSSARGSPSPSQEDEQSGASSRTQDTDDRPTTTPQPRSTATQQKGGTEDAGDGCCSGAKGQSHSEGRGRRGTSGNNPRKTSINKSQEVPDHGPNARRESLRLSGTSVSQSTCIGQQQQEERCAVTIQRNVRGTGRRKKFLTLQSNREDFEHHLQALVSAATAALAQQQQQQQQQQQNEGALQRVYTAAMRLSETGREHGLAKPPFDILRDMYRGIGEVARALDSLSVGEGEEVGAGAGAGGDGRRSVLPPDAAAGMTESCGAAKEALDAIREAVGADIASDLGERAISAGAGSSPMAPRHHQNQPVGSGRAAAVAMASGRGGMLVSPEDSAAAYPERIAGESSREYNDAGKEARRTGSAGERRHVQPVPLRSLDVKSVAELLRASGFEEHAPGFIAQGVDGVMLSDPNLCDTDFAELGLGGGDEGGRDVRARMVALFLRYQQGGVVFPDKGSSSHLATGGAGQRPGEQSSGDSSLDKRRREDRPSTDQNNLRSPEESSSWRRGSVLVNRENQRVLAQITLDPSETGRSGAASSREKRNVRRMSVKLNNGVVVTAGGRQEVLFDNADEISAINADVAATAAKVGAEDEAVAETSTSPASSHGRKTSIGLRTIPLYRESSQAGEGGSSNAAGNPPLPPGVAIAASDATVDVFR